MPPNEVQITEPPRSLLRHPTDLQRLIVGLLVTGIGFLLATYLNTINEAITVEVINGVGTFPGPVVVLGIITVDFIAFIVPVAALGYLMWRREWRRLLVGAVAAAAAIAVVVLVEDFVVSKFAAGDLPFTPPNWVCTTEPTGFGLDCIAEARGWGSIVYVTALTAFFSTLTPSLTRRWRMFGWVLIGLLTIARMIDGLKPPVDDILIIAISYSIGAAVLLILGTPDRRPRGAAITEALARSGLQLESLSVAAVDARGSTPYFGTTVEGERLFIKVLTPEERAADNMFRVVRMARLKGVGDERPFSSLKRAVEHEAVVALKATADGVHTPKLEALADIPPNSVVLTYDMIDGSSLDGVESDELTDEILDGIWAQVEVLRHRRTAHRDLRLANVFLDDDAQPWLIDFGFSELAATDGQLQSDIAELVVSTAEKVGPDRAVASAVKVLGPEPIAAASTRIQPIALSGATREALKRQKGLDEQVREQIAQQTDTEIEPLEDLERIKGKTILMIVGFTLAIYFLIPQLAQTDFGAVLD
ncbi:MAG: hypothetical protein ACR2N2_10275, partial [Acidimicrobiia bacterium]